MIYELREYTTVPGRMGDVVKRFNDHAIALFKKHGMDLMFISKTEFGDVSNNELVFALRFDSYGDMEHKWHAFHGDPAWQTVRAESEKDGPLVSTVRRRILDPTAFRA
ncbi:NIPSNAP family protein (plasmid) [Rhodococcus sp. USK10]|uniref:NIPSNAP family protein n=1 Tax=Rhodococcus sp. USK10 TaxID=2789739 RepID=UPI001C5CEA70|nr:NIPSNAP family protein [Rhodococcus sp. USK10]QYB00182.1 NIPSNAP family protein [Rhodococcus sp. USK10]